MSLQVKPFYLLRHEDISGLSGTGVVALGVEFPNGKAVMQWVSYRTSLEICESVVNIEEIHGHGGKTEVIFGNPPAPCPPKSKKKKKEDV